MKYLRRFILTIALTLSASLANAAIVTVKYELELDEMSSSDSSVNSGSVLNSYDDAVELITFSTNTGSSGLSLTATKYRGGDIVVMDRFTATDLFTANGALGTTNMPPLFNDVYLSVNQIFSTPY
ncbi:hypothetical protein EXU34_20755 [Alteromonas sp. ZYF713]|nr:hypothetical protein [Alteromonas sp. ZYF713]